jgi:hypothetical protein
VALLQFLMEVYSVLFTELQCESSSFRPPPYSHSSLNLPQCAVLGLHSIKDKPVVVDGQIVIRPIMV